MVMAFHWPDHGQRRGVQVVNTLNKLAARFEGMEYVRQHPKTGLWYGIDRVLRCPITEGHATPDAAKAEWRLINAQWAGDTATRSQQV